MSDSIKILLSIKKHLLRDYTDDEMGCRLTISALKSIHDVSELLTIVSKGFVN